MSSFKQLSRSDVTVVANNANKQWTLPYCPYPTSSNYLTIYKGTNVPGIFSEENDPITEGQYERLIYTEINQLFYQTYTSSLDTSSLAKSIYYESASQQRPTSSYFIFNDNANLIRNFPTGNYQGNCKEYTLNYVAGGGDVYYDYYNCISSSVSIGPMTGGSQTFCALSGSVSVLSGNYTLTDNGYCAASSSLIGIRVLAINQNIFGNKVLPGNFQISSSAYNIKDDSYGNLFDYSGSKTHIGNIFYAHGLAIITNQDYQLMFPLPPIARNNTGSFLSTEAPKVISSSLNDYARSGTLLTSSIAFSGSTSGPGYSFATASNGTIVLTTTIAGTYTAYYTIGASFGSPCNTTIRSNVAKVTVTVTAPTCSLYGLAGGKGDLTVFHYTTCSGAPVTESLSDFEAPERCVSGSINKVSGPGGFYLISASCS